jgi:TATA-binding protein-associated factor Taf7
MKCRITNNMASARIYYDVNLRPVTVNPGKTVECDLPEGTYHDALALARAKLGPEIESLDGDEPSPLEQYEHAHDEGEPDDEGEEDEHEEEDEQEQKSEPHTRRKPAARRRKRK